MSFQSNHRNTIKIDLSTWIPLQQISNKIFNFRWKVILDHVTPSHKWKTFKTILPLIDVILSYMHTYTNAGWNRDIRKPPWCWESLAAYRESSRTFWRSLCHRTEAIQSAARSRRCLPKYTQPLGYAVVCVYVCSVKRSLTQRPPIYFLAVSGCLKDEAIQYTAIKVTTTMRYNLEGEPVFGVRPFPERGTREFHKMWPSRFLPYAARKM